MNRKSFSNMRFLGLVAIVAIAFFVSIILFQDNNKNSIISAYEGIPKAAIIDQLYDDVPRDWFHQQATEYLEAAGYQVDIFTTKDVTVDLFKNLPSMNYKLIIVRTHGVAEKNIESVTLFTGERYRTDKYISEQLLGLVKKGTPLYRATFPVQLTDSSEWNIENDTYRSISVQAHPNIQSEDVYFLITPKLVDDIMVGQFPGTVFFLGGCSTMKNPSMASSLIARGASAVVGWDDTVGDYENDIIMIDVLRQYLINDSELKEAVKLVMENYEWGDPMYNATFKYYSEPLV